MIEQKGRTESIYYNGAEVVKLDELAAKYGVNSKERIKARSLSDDGCIKICQKIQFDNEIKQALHIVAKELYELECFFMSLDSASSELLIHADIIDMCKRHQFMLVFFKKTIDKMIVLQLKAVNAS